MKLRNLKITDAPFMLEWMHDDEVVHYMQSNFQTKTLLDCESFIKMSQGDEENLHLALVDENDEYMGTVSLKKINRENRTAEFAITIRKCAMGRGYSSQAMKMIIEKAFEEFDLKSVYWCVSPENKRAVRFYDKNGYIQKTPSYIEKIDGYTEQQIKKYIWYQEDRTDS